MTRAATTKKPADPTWRAGGKDKDGYALPPRSTCCGGLVVGKPKYPTPNHHTPFSVVEWDEAMQDFTELRCAPRRCNRPLTQ